MSRERRRKRSSYVGLALQYWLSSVAQRKRLMALVVADSAGLLVAASFQGPEAEELAALAPLLARPGQPGAPLDEAPELPMEIRQMQVDCSSLYLCAIGDLRSTSDGLRLAESGIQRILQVH